MLIQSEQVEVGIVRLTLDDPAHDNSLSAELVDELIDTLAILAQKPDLSVLLVCGGERVFSSGAPLERLLAATPETPAADLYWPLLDALSGFPLPVVGALEGQAVGGGLMLALLLCDIIVASETSRYGLNFAELGFTPGMGATHVLPALTGYSTAFELLTTARFYRGEELRHSGLFGHIVSKGQVRNWALDLARQIAGKPRHVLLMLKEILAEPRRQGLRQAVERESAMQALCFAHPETAARIAAAYLIPSDRRP